MSGARFKTGELVGYVRMLEDPDVVRPALILKYFPPIFSPRDYYTDCGKATIICGEETITAMDYELYPFEAVGELGKIPNE